MSGTTLSTLCFAGRLAHGANCRSGLLWQAGEVPLYGIPG